MGRQCSKSFRWHSTRVAAHKRRLYGTGGGGGKTPTGGSSSPARTLVHSPSAHLSGYKEGLIAACRQARAGSAGRRPSSARKRAATIV